MKHVDHIELTWRILGDAFQQLEETLSGLARAAGRPEKYDHELTRDFFEIIAARRHEGESFADFLARNPDLVISAPKVVMTHRSKKLC